MKQVTQTLRTGVVEVQDVPIPNLKDNFVLVRNHVSVISAGTEKSKIDLGKKNLLQKARARPDLVRQVLAKLRTEGIVKTLRTVTSRLGEENPLGYSSCGTVIAAGGLVEGIMPGDRVACAGADYANHAEVVAVPRNLIAKVPDAVSDEQAAFATIGSIALQGVRLAEPKLGETFLVIGLGLVGQLVVQLLRANGCHVIGSDLDPAMVKLSETFGATGLASASLLEGCLGLTEGKGVDGVLVCAATSSNQPIEVSGEVTREKGRVVVIGAVRMDIPREHYFRKEISLVISRSYGPGRYDSSYEESGLDYPYGYVRFTEQRNMVAFLSLVEKKSIDIDSLITHRFPLDDAGSAYSMIAGDRKEPYLGILLVYQKPVPGDETKTLAEPAGKPLATGKVGISLYGAGNYATASLLPALNSLQQVEFRGVSTASGRTAKTVSDRFGFQFAADDLAQILADESDVVMIASRHDSHASSVVAALELGKRVYVEKPLALTLEELANIHQTVIKKKSVNLMVGFNRRFAPMTLALMDHFQDCQSPLVVNLRVNAGALPDDHWTLDPSIGGGRLIGEGCHFLDLAATICGSNIASVFAVATSKPNKSALLNDNFCICASFGNGSVANITYTADGSKALSKERIEVFGGGRSGVIVDFRELILYENEKKTVHKKKLSQDKGQQAMLATWLDQLADGNNCISYEALMNTSIAAIKSIESLIINQPMQVDISALDVE